MKDSALRRTPSIYMILCKPTGKIYIGQTADTGQRWAVHRHQLRRKTHGNRYLQRAWDKHGEDSFEFKALEIIEDTSILTEREQAWIDHMEAMNPEKGFNIYDATASPAGRKASAETRKKMSEARSGRKHSDETKAKIAAAHKGKSKHTPASRLKLSMQRRGSNGAKAKLNEEDVMAIKKRLATGERYKPIAKDYGVSEVQISLIKTGKQWSWVTID